MTDQIVRLNIGGYKYQTTRSTLASRGENFFTKLLEGKIGSVKDEEGYYFVDRDGQYFQPILSFLRTGLLTLPDGMTINLVDVEANFYLINIHPNLANATEQNTAMQYPGVRFNGIYWSLASYYDENFSATTLRPDSTLQYYEYERNSKLEEQRGKFKTLNETTLEVQNNQVSENGRENVWLLILTGKDTLTRVGTYGRKPMMPFCPSLPPLPNRIYKLYNFDLAFTNEDMIKIKYDSKTVFGPIRPTKKTTPGGIIKYSFKLDHQKNEIKGKYTIYSFGVLLLVKTQVVSGLAKYFVVVEQK